MREEDLLLKLFLTNHLSVPERKHLPSGKVRQSIARELIESNLKENGWFPGTEQNPIGDLGGEYYQIELGASQNCVLHHNYECSYLQYDHRINHFSSIEDSITAYLKAKEKEGLDGLALDWEA